MKIIRFVSIAALSGCMIAASAFGTTVGISIVEQPVNLGLKSDPTRIPLGRVPVLSNYDYGIHRMIGEARLCPDGPMRWEGGSELDQNLASVCGISVEAEDPTQISAFPITLRMKPWKVPAYSPYSKEQVLAATLWCLLDSASGTPEKPLDIRVVAEGDADKPLEMKYSGKYINRPGKDQKPVPSAIVPGTVIEKDARGITWATFPEIQKKDPFVPLSPSVIILESQGDGDDGWFLLPVWGNGDNESDFLKLNGWSANIFYSCYKSRGVRQANSFLQTGGSHTFDVTHSDNGDVVTMGLPNVPEATLAANILALVIAAQPTETKSLTVRIQLEECGLAAVPAFRNAGGWSEIKHSPHYITLECEFVWDPVTKTLMKGSIPLVHLEEQGWIVSNSEQNTSADIDSAKVAASVQSIIKSGIATGTLFPEKNMSSYDLAESGLSREITKAGYYEALATYSSGDSLPATALDAPFKPANSEYLQAYQRGWTIGLGHAESIAIEARKALEKEKEKQKKSE